MEWHDHLRVHGFAHFRGLVPGPLVQAALGAIKRDLRENYDPRRQLEYDNQSYCPGLRGTPPVTDLLEASPARDILDETLGIGNVEWDGGQIAIRRARNHRRPRRNPTSTASPAALTASTAGRSTA